jgi:hypothetical protein
MFLLYRLLGAYLVRRLFGGGGRRGRRGYASRPYGYGRRRSRGGFGFAGPFPSYSRRTRGGSRVSVSGCCLPIPLTLALTAAGGTRALVRRRGRA